MKIGTEHMIYKFSAKNQPALRVCSGARISIDTFDCFCNQLRSPEDKLEALDWDRVNPATGPVYVEDAEPGDVLKVTIESIHLDEKGTVVSGEEFGLLGGILKGSHLRVVPIKAGVAEFVHGIRIPIRPMIGVIGVAPGGGEEINTGTPGHHGGNMDNTMIEEGAILYFPVAVKGALFALGDLHAVMGDGEIGVSGLEIPAEVQVTLEVIKGRVLANPMLENDSAWVTIASEETVDAAIQTAVEEMLAFLTGRTELSDPELAMLMSLVGNVQICQVVDPLKTARFVIPKEYLGVKVSF